MYGVARLVTVLGTIATLAYLAYDLVSIQFRLGPRIGVRALVAIALPILAGSYAYARHRGALRRFQSRPAVTRFTAGVVAGMLVMASLRFFLVLYLFLVPELWVASCLAFLAFGSGAFPGLAFDEPAQRSDRLLAPFYGIAAGMLLYILLLGVPRIVPG